MRILVDEGPARVHELIALGVEFDREATGLLALAREGGHSRPASSTPAAPPPVPRSSGPWSTPPTARPAPCSRGGSPSTSWWRAGAASASRRSRPDGSARPWRCGPQHVVLATGGAGPAVLGHHQPRRVHRRRRRHGAAGGRADGRRRVRPVPPDRPAPPRHAPAAALRGAARPRRAPARPRTASASSTSWRPRDVVSRAMAARMDEQGVDHLWLDATGLERFSQRFPTIAASLASIGLDPEHDWLPIAPAAHHLSGGVVDRPVGGHGAPRPVGRGRGGLHGRARGQPAGVQLAARGHGLRRTAGRAHPVGDGRSRAERRAARRARGRAARRHRVHRCWSARRERRPAGRRRAARGRRDEAARHAAAGHDPGRRRRAQRRVAGGRPRGRRRDRRPCSATRRLGRRRGAGATCSSWPTRCWSRRWPAPRAGVPTRGGEFPDTDPSWRRRLVHGTGSARAAA